MKTIISRNTLLVKSQDLVFAELSPDPTGSIVILSFKDEVYYELKEVAARFWNLIQQPCSFGVVLDALLEDYEVDAERCEADLIALVEDLSKRGLIEIKSDSKVVICADYPRWYGSSEKANSVGKAAEVAGWSTHS